MTWFRGMMNEEVINIIVGEQMTHQVSISIKDSMLSLTKRTRKLVEGNLSSKKRSLKLEKFLKKSSMELVRNYQPLGNRSWMMTKYFNLLVLLVPSMLI